jgi:hypothetical protein
VDLPFDAFCAAIKVPQWGSHGKIKERPRPLIDLYEEICQGRNFSKESGKIRSIHLPSIRYFPILLPSVFLLGRLQTNYLLMI